MERKLLTILFVDLVGSTALVASTDPEVARRRVGNFLTHVRECIEVHGGTVGRYAGDAIMAAFGTPVAHEDDAARAVRAGLSILDSVSELGLDARVGVESGEVLTDEDDITFATGEAINVAVRLQQAAAPGQLLIGPAAHRLTLGNLEAEELGPVDLKGLEQPIWAWHATAVLDGAGRRQAVASPFVGREAELELLENTYRRLVRDRRAHLFTVFGEPGVGKSRMTREFLEGVEGATILFGRCLPYGEGITYWPVGEMVKAAAGITDDDPVKEAVDKLRMCCEDEAVADLLGLASGVLDAVESERSQQEIAWAVREFVERLAQPQPLVLVFEDIHWAEEPLLQLIEHLADSVREVPVLILCLARPELLEVHYQWGGGRLQATAIELDALPDEEAGELVDALLAGRDLAPALRTMLLEKAGGNPLFVEETIRMVLEDGLDGAVERIPDTVQALIAARIDRLPRVEKELLQRAAVIGRVFWPGAVAELAPDLDVEPAVGALVQRDLVLRDARSSISDEHAFRFKHVLIREVAYGGLSKDARAELHTRFAGWLSQHAGDEMLEIRAYHLDQAAELRAELDGAAPAELASAAAAALEEAGVRALARDAHRSARKLFLRALELEPTLARRHRAARAAWRLTDLPVVRREMEEVAAAARREGDRGAEGKALVALAEVAILQDGDVPRARALIGDALERLQDHDLGRWEALDTLVAVEWSVGDLAAQQRVAREALEIAQGLGRKDLESEAVNHLASGYMAQLRLDEAEPYVERALALAEESGRIVARGLALRYLGLLRLWQNELDEAERALEESRGLLAEAGASWSLARTLDALGWTARLKGRPAVAERHFREAIRILKPLEDRAALCEVQRALSQLRVEQGKLEEAERLAHEARETVGPQDRTSLATTTMALGIVRAAQRRDEEAEQLFERAIATAAETDFRRTELVVLEAMIQFLRSRGREDDAARYERRIAELTPAQIRGETQGSPTSPLLNR